MEKLYFCDFTRCRRNNPSLQNGCSKWHDNTKCRIFRKEPERFTPRYPKQKPLQKLLPKYSSSTYTFRGPISLTHLTNDCIKDQKSAFIAVDSAKCTFGFSRQVSMETVKEFASLPGTKRLHDTYLPFHVFSTEKENINFLMKELENIHKLVIKQKRKTRKILATGKKSGKFTNKPETKVMVY